VLLSSRDIPAELHGGGRFVMPDRDFVPVYLKTYEEGRLREKVEEALEALRDCTLCPRDCHVDRLANRFAVCKVGRYARVSSFFPHFGEEDVLRGWAGSGTIFFAWCNLRCVFCLHPNTRIATDHGLVRIADLFEQARGEPTGYEEWVRFVHGKIRVLTRTGTWAPVTKVFRHRFVGHLIRVKPFNCPPILLTPNHEVFAIPKEGAKEPIRVRAECLTKASYLLVPRRIQEPPATQLDVQGLLSTREPVLRTCRPRRHTSDELGSLFSQPLTSRELAVLTGYHPAYVRRLRGQWRRGRLLAHTGSRVAQVVSEGDRVRFRVERQPGIPSRLAMDPRLAWLLGIYCAEGHVTAQRARPNSYRLVFSFGRHEWDLASRTRKVLEELFDVQPEVRERHTTLTVEVGKASLATLFAQLCGKGARHKRVPPILMGCPVDVVQAFLEGVLEGDGCDGGTHRVVNTISEQLAMELFQLGLRLGMLPSFYRWDPAPTKMIEGRKVKQSPLYYVKFPKADPKTGRPRVRWKATEEYFLVPIHRIERVPYDGPVFNLEVDHPDHSYAASFVAVGNCQNYETSQIGEGVDVSPRELAAMMLRLQELGCHNINFVTPEHVVPQILEALAYAVEGGLRLPLVYNTSSYDSLHSIRLMEGVVDVYMPDFKLWFREHARKYLLAPDYPEVAREVIRAMHEQVGVLKVNEDGLARRGVLVRHLVMPGLLDDTREILRWLGELSPDTYVNVMDQYHPAWKARTEAKYVEINRRITRAEYQQAVAYAREVGLWRLDTRWRRGPYLVL